MAFIDQRVDAHTDRSLDSTGAVGDISFTATGQSHTTSVAEAAANGAADNSSGDSSNDKADKNLGTAKTTQADNAGGKTTSKDKTPKNGTADGETTGGDDDASISFSLRRSRSTSSRRSARPTSPTA